MQKQGVEDLGKLNPTLVKAQQMEKDLNGSLEDEELQYQMSVYEKLKAPFPKEAYSTDSSRGFDLTSLKAQYVVERLNEVLGIMNWTHGGEAKPQEDGSVLYEGALIINVAGTTNKFYATGYAAKKKNIGDAHKGAKTDALCKAASQIGVGNDAFKGLINPRTFELTSAPAKPQAAKAVSKAKSAPSGFKTKSKAKKGL